MRDRKKHIAFVYEGEKTEKVLVDRMKELFFQDIADVLIFSFPACGNIYMIWNKLRENEFEIDVIDAIREISPKAEEILEGYSPRDFSEVYLFFDYDAHNDNLPQVYRNTDVVQEMLHAFDNETENGKLYISYPMIESLREMNTKIEDYKSLYVPIDELIHYKQYVSEEIEFQNFGCLTREQWEAACRGSVKRAHLIVSFQDELPTYHYFLNELTQKKIYEAQRERFVKLNHMVGVLNSLPLFLLEYFEEEFWKRVICRENEKEQPYENCNSGRLYGESR